MQSFNPKIIMVLAKQVQQCVRKGPDGVKMIINQSDATDIQAEILGPTGTPYQGGIFKCQLVIGSDFPNNPPKGYFLTKIFHPNVSQKGQICVNTLKKDWNPAAWSLHNILEVIKCLLIVPFPQSALNEEAGKLFMQDYQQYFKYAKLLTQLHAKPKELKKNQYDGRIKTRNACCKKIEWKQQQEKMDEKNLILSLNSFICNIHTSKLILYFISLQYANLYLQNLTKLQQPMLAQLDKLFVFIGIVALPALYFQAQYNVPLMLFCYAIWAPAYRALIIYLLLFSWFIDAFRLFFYISHKDSKQYAKKQLVLVIMICLFVLKILCIVILVIFNIDCRDALKPNVMVKNFRQTFIQEKKQQ